MLNCQLEHGKIACFLKSTLPPNLQKRIPASESHESELFTLAVRAALERKKNVEKEKAVEALGQVATDNDETSNANALKSKKSSFNSTLA